MISEHKILGSLIYRTAQALNDNTAFNQNINHLNEQLREQYPFYDAMVKTGRLNLWHYPGTIEEIQSQYLYLDSNRPDKSAVLKYPSVLSFTSIEQKFTKDYRVIQYNLSFITKSVSGWTTQQRDKYIFEPFLTPIVEEFIHQVDLADYWVKGIEYTVYNVPTTGNTLGSSIKLRYGDYIDAVELPKFIIRVMTNICDQNQSQIEKESIKVTSDIKNLLQ
jgi:hypothetical protein